MHVLEDTRSRWNAEVAAKEASLAAKEETLAADSRQRDADLRRRLAQEQQVSILLQHYGHCGIPGNNTSHRRHWTLPCVQDHTNEMAH